MSNNIESPRHSEVPSVSFQEMLGKLSNIENPTPLNPSEIDVSKIRQELIDAGIKINLIENNQELKDCFKNTEFRGPNQGRGPAVAVALDGLDSLNHLDSLKDTKTLEELKKFTELNPEKLPNYIKFFNWAMEISEKQKPLKGQNELTKCRGLMQFLGETVALASGQMTKEDYCQKVNFRVGKKYKKNSELEEKFNLAECENLDAISSVPKGSVIEAYKFILSLNKNN